MSKGEQTRIMILEKAAVVFNSKGYHATSLSDVMRITGLEKGGIYNHFASKDELALATFEHVVGKIRVALAESVRGVRNALERLDRVVSVFRRMARGFPVPGGCPVMNTAIEADHAHPGLCAVARKTMDEWRRFLGGIVASGVERGELSESADAGQLSYFIISTLEGAIMLGSLYGEPGIVDDAASGLMEYIGTNSVR